MHPWFQAMLGDTTEPTDLDPDVVQRLITIKNWSTLQKVTLRILVEMIPKPDLVALRAQFEAINTTGTGLIDLPQLTDALTKLSIEITPDAV